MKNALRWMVSVCLVLIFFAQFPISVHGQSKTQMDSLYWLDWSQDGAKVAVATTEGITIYDSAFRILAFRPQPDPNGHLTLAGLSPDGTMLATLNEIWDTKTLQTIGQVESQYELGAWSPDSKFIAGLAFDLHNIVVFNGANGKPVKTLSSGDIYPLSGLPTWSPDGTHLAALIRGRGIFIFDVAQGSVSTRYANEYPLSFITWSPDGKYLAYSEFAEVAPGTSGSIPSSGSIKGAIRNSVYITDVSTGQILYTFTGLSDSIAHLVWSPDNIQLLGVTGFGQVNIWDMKTGQQIDNYKSPGYLLVGVNYSPFGGQVMLGFNKSRDITSPIRDTFADKSAFVANELLGGAIQIVVPAPSLEKLQAIAQRCGAKADVTAALQANITAKQLPAFMTQVQSLSGKDIPAACAADLLAVAQALQAK